MLKDKRFWVGFLVAYGLAVVFPPTKLLTLGKGMGKGNSGS
ncbi:MAG TPA: hypothetical protein VJ914_11670 [Pseudonocardiaceae bacterium]|nr:hypothetical protein [Pseudonocardiaceae bacterium]